MSLDSQPSTLNPPLVLYGDAGRGGLRVTACCRAAAAAGVKPGMRLAEAEGLWPPDALRRPRGPQFVPHDLAADHEALIRLAEWCQRFTPLVGIAGTDSLRLDVTGCAHLFGGEWGLARRVLHDFRRCGLRVQIGLADTAGAAWAAAHHGLAESRRRPPAVDESGAVVVNRTAEEKKIADCKLHNANCKLKGSEPPVSVRRTANLNAVTHQQNSPSENSICNLPAAVSVAGAASAICNLQSSFSPPRSPALRSERHAIRIVPPGEQQHALSALPVEALRLPPDTLALLHSLSLRCIEQLFSVPRSTLPARFGPELLQRIDQALGRVAEPIIAVRPRPLVSADWTLPAPTADHVALENAVGRLIRQVTEQLAARREGVQKLEVCFRHSAGPATTLSVGTVQPTAAWQHLLNLALAQLERTLWHGEVLSVTVVARTIVPLPSHQPQLLESAQPQKNRRALAQLADRLSTRLGKDHVVQPVLHADPQPELAVHWQPEIRTPKSEIRNADRRLAESRRRPRERRGSAPPSCEPIDVARRDHSDFGFRISGFAARPLQLLPDPEPIDVACAAGAPVRVTRGGRVHHVAACCGPERIETGWWRGADVQRDYFRVDTTEGLRWWLFRQLEQADWFLHGEFD